MKKQTKKTTPWMKGFKRSLSGSVGLPMKEMGVQSLGWEDPLQAEMATDSSILAWKIPWTEEPSGLQSMGSQRVDMTD